MTVEELIAELKKYDSKLEVHVYATDDSKINEVIDYTGTKELAPDNQFILICGD